MYVRERVVLSFSTDTTDLKESTRRMVLALCKRSKTSFVSKEDRLLRMQPLNSFRNE